MEEAKLGGGGVDGARVRAGHPGGALGCGGGSLARNELEPELAGVALQRCAKGGVVANVLKVAVVVYCPYVELSAALVGKSGGGIR